MTLVSVIIPNYNHASYLEKRIQSVLNQTYRNIEVIILDDCSLDNSCEIINSYAEKDKRIQVELNKQNSGTTFKQWEKGIELANGEYIWIAESDDFAELNFLEQLIPILEVNPKVGIAYCQSWNVDQKGDIKGSYIEWTRNIDKERWKSPFINNGQDELKNYFCLLNTIPNASAAVFRKSLVEKIHTQSKLVGDKFFWTDIMLKSDVAFIPEHLNYFRHHPQNVRTNSKDEQNLTENFHWVTYLYSKVKIPRKNRKKIRQRLFMWWVGLIQKSNSLEIHNLVLTQANKFSKMSMFFLLYYYLKYKLNQTIK